MTPNLSAAPMAFGDLLTQATRAPAREDLALALGLRALEERGEEDALAAVAAAARHAPQNANLFHVLGLIHRAIGDIEPAIAAFDRALALAPDSPRLVHARARAALEAGRPSLEWFARARRLAPNDGDVILGEAAALLAAREPAAADALLAATLGQHPGWLPGHEALIRMRHALGNHGEALSALDIAIAGAPADARLHNLRIVALHRGTDGDAAFTALESARKSLGDTPLVRDLAAVVAAEHAGMAEADAAFARIDPLAQPDVALHWFRHLLRRGEPDRIPGPESLAVPIRDVAWPYLSIAWRLLDDPRHVWLDDESFIKIIDLGEDWPLLGPLAEVLRGLHIAEDQPLDQSVRGGTQTDGPLLHRIDPALVALRECLRREVAAYIEALPHRDLAHPLAGRLPAHPRFVGSWSVRLSGGGYHEPHVHGEGRISSALYVALPPPDGTAQSGWLTLGQPQASLGLDLPPVRLVEPRRGRLVLFPSTMWHGTRPFASGERLSVAFDVA